MSSVVTGLPPEETGEMVSMEEINAAFVRGCDLMQGRVGTWADGKGFWSKNLALIDVVEKARRDAIELERFNFNLSKSSPTTRAAYTQESLDINISAINTVYDMHVATLMNLIIVEKQMLVVTEGAEFVEGLRTGEPDKDCAALGFSNQEVELADQVIRILDMGFHRKWRIGACIVAKMSKNDKRPHMHGRKF